ncbi:hypothetical protein GCM10022252_50980 [Streptosporangium oxazolinicum]|uniref:Uncharacterized protein n=1 Tax=Streptosporangium oxazolinicum TaxID=909287 RepID=A0ABP8B6Z8_9ACTN
MPVNDWHILGDMATRRVNGQEVEVKVAGFPGIHAAIEDWETRERARQVRDLRELGRLVDGAIARLQTRHETARGVSEGQARRPAPKVGPTRAPGSPVRDATPRAP